ncbi:DUF1804 family protein [Klebsiella michiganensis]|nr:DUF1804 family protein [Klebsiella michiganensis]
MRRQFCDGTARWKKDAQDSGDDWDKLRAANVLAGNGMEDVGTGPS